MMSPMTQPRKVGGDAFSDRYTWANLFVVVPKASPDSESLRAAMDEMRAFVRERQSGCGMLVIVEAGSKMLDRPMLEELSKGIRELEGNLRALAVLITATGFLHAVVPVVGLLMRRSSRKYPRNLTRTSSETGAWLAPYLTGPEQSIDAAGVTSAIEAMRGMVRAGAGAS